MSKIEEYKSVRDRTKAVKEFAQDVIAGTKTVSVAGGAITDNAGWLDVRIDFGSKGWALVDINIARVMAAAIEKNMPRILDDVVAAVEAKREAVRATARAEAQEVLREVGP